MRISGWRIYCARFHRIHLLWGKPEGNSLKGQTYESTAAHLSIQWHNIATLLDELCIKIKTTLLYFPIRSPQASLALFTQLIQSNFRIDISL